MRLLLIRLFALTLLPVAFAGCSIVQASKLYAPTTFGFTSVSDGIYIEAGANEATRTVLREAMAQAQVAVRITYGSVNSHPIVHACITEACYTSFGGGTSIAKVYGDRILLSPRGLNWHFLAHEWSHVEIRSRLTLSAWWHMPQWFDEGVAVAVSEAPEHSEMHWQFLVQSNIPRPTRDELMTFKSLRQWLDAVSRYGEPKNKERREKGEPEIRPVYSAAGHELRPWLARVGRSNLIRFIASLNNGEDFATTYANFGAQGQ